MAKDIEMKSSQKTIPTILLKATSILAENLVQSEPFLHFQEIDRKLHKNEVAMQILTEFSELQQTIRNQQKSDAISESDIKRLRELQRVIGINDIIQEQGQAQEMAVVFLREVNQEISNHIGIDFASLTRRAGGCC